MKQADVKPNERAAVITFKLATGGTVTTTEVAEWCQVSRRTAQRDILAIERVLPLGRDSQGGIFLVNRE